MISFHTHTPASPTEEVVVMVIVIPSTEKKKLWFDQGYIATM